MSVLLTASHRDFDQEIAAIDNFHRRRVDGILVTDSRISKQHRAQVGQISVPTVLINSQIEDQPEMFHSVTIDDRLGARLAVEHLVSLGHTSIGYLGVGDRSRSNQQPTGVTGIFCYNDMVAVGALLTCQELGISVPRDLSLVGFDGIALGCYVTPPLTTVTQPMTEIGSYAMQMLLDLLQEKSVENRLLSPFLVKRGSSTALRNDHK